MTDTISDERLAQAIAHAETVREWQGPELLSILTELLSRRASDKPSAPAEAFGSLMVALAQAGLGLRDKTPEEIAGGGDQCKLFIVNRPLETAAAERDALAKALAEAISDIRSLASTPEFGDTLALPYLAALSCTKGPSQ